jgi:hypothetical protein
VSLLFFIPRVRSCSVQTIRRKHFLKSVGYKSGFLGIEIEIDLVYIWSARALSACRASIIESFLVRHLWC